MKNRSISTNATVLLTENRVKSNDSPETPSKIVSKSFSISSNSRNENIEFVALAYRPQRLSCRIDRDMDAIIGMNR